MAFTIFIRAPYIDIEAFYSYEGWDASEAKRTEYTNMIERCIAIDPGSTTEMEDIVEDLIDPGKEYLSGVGEAVSGCDASIEVDDQEIDNPFGDYEKYDLPELEVLIPELINSKFCFVKVWENSGGWVYNGDGEFDLAKLTWEKGRFAYDGEEFEFTDGDGSSSYTYFYKDGEVVG